METTNITTLQLRKSISRSPLRLGLFLIPLALAWFALSPTARAVTPAPDGGYPGQNTAEGDSALFSLTTGVDNTAVGFNALFANTTGYTNTASGSGALNNNTTGYENTANGFNALQNNTTGRDNTATGLQALQFNTTGVVNTAIGVNSLIFNTIGSYNTATGAAALEYNTSGSFNTANGFAALDNNTTGNNNTAMGYNALIFNTTGSSNIVLGFAAGFNLTTGSNNIDIGNQGVAGDSGIMRLGTEGTQTAVFIAGIRTSGLAVASGVGITVDGQLGVRASSARFKEAIKPMDKASEAILALRPVSFRYKKELDPKATPQFGLVAEEVEKVDPDLVAYDASGKPYTVRYEEVNAMLLNEFLKEHRRVEAQEANISELKSSLAQQQKDFQSAVAEQRRANEALTATLKAQAAQIQNVSDQLRTQSPASRVVTNN